MKQALKWFLIICGILFVLGLGSCALLIGGASVAVNEVDKELTKQKEVTNSKDEALQVILENAKIEEVFNGYSSEVKVTMTNDTEYVYDYIQIEYAEYDDNNVKLDSFFANATDIAPGETFQLQFHLLNQDTKSYKITSISSSLF